MTDNMTKDAIISFQIPAEDGDLSGRAAYVFDVSFPKLEMVKLPAFYSKNIHECVTAANRAVSGSVPEDVSASASRNAASTNWMTGPK